MVFFSLRGGFWFSTANSSGPIRLSILGFTRLHSQSIKLYTSIPICCQFSCHHDITAHTVIPYSNCSCAVAFLDYMTPLPLTIHSLICVFGITITNLNIK